MSRTKGETPIEVARRKTTSKLFRSGRRVKLHFSDFSKAQIFIGVVTPKMMPSGFTTFDLCLARTCVEAGKLAFFGSKDANSTAPPKVNSNTYKLSDMDVTKVVLEQGWKADDDLQAVLTNTLVEDLPHPVVIHKFTGPGKVKLPKGKTRRDYGDLLDDYSIVSKAKDI